MPVAVDPETILTPRQLELLAAFASGDDYQQIATKKFLSYHTVRHTLNAALKNSGARSLTHLVAVAVDIGLLRQGADGHYEAMQEREVIGE